MKKLEPRTKHTLTQEDVQFLAEHFQQFAGEDVSGFRIIPGEQWSNRSSLEHYLNQLKTVLHSDSSVAVASTFTKKYAYFIVTAGLVPKSVFHKSPRFDFDNIQFIHQEEEQKWTPKISFMDKEVTVPEDFRSREEWLRFSYSRLFRDHIKELFDAVHDITRLSKKVMWENLAHHTFWFYERYGKQILDERQWKTAQRDFQFLIHTLNGEAFGEDSNPLSYFAGLNRLPNGAPIRKYCCLTYLLNGESHNCKVCPHIH